MVQRERILQIKVVQSDEATDLNQIKLPNFVESNRFSRASRNGFGL